MNQLPIDIVQIVEDDLVSNQRPPDDKLHASSDLVGSLRHTQLRFVGAPTVDRELVDSIRLQTGWFWHNHIGNLLVDRGVPVVREFNVTPWMPEGWSGTADWLFWHPEALAWCVTDLKTSKGESIKWKVENGMSVDHHWQLSAYYYALLEAGLPMVKQVYTLYFPMNNTIKEKNIKPLLTQAPPVPKDEIMEVMKQRYQACLDHQDAMLAERERWSLETGEHPDSYPTDDDVLNDKLAPTIDRVQKLVWDAPKRVFNLILVPHWLTDFCPFDNSLCDCSEQGTTKIGHYELLMVNGGYKVEFVPRKGYDVPPDKEPTVKEFRRRLKL